MRTFSAKSVVAVAVLAWASASAWASAQRDAQPDVLIARAQTGMQRAEVNDFATMQTAGFYATPVAPAQPIADRLATVTAVPEPAPGQEQANMGMMILVGLGMVGTVMFKNNRS